MMDQEGNPTDENSIVLEHQGQFTYKDAVLRPHHPLPEAASVPAPTVQMPSRAGGSEAAEKAAQEKQTRNQNDRPIDLKNAVLEELAERQKHQKEESITKAAREVAERAADKLEGIAFNGAEEIKEWSEEKAAEWRQKGQELAHVAREKGEVLKEKAEETADELRRKMQDAKVRIADGETRLEEKTNNILEAADPVWMFTAGFTVGVAFTIGVHYLQSGGKLW